MQDFLALKSISLEDDPPMAELLNQRAFEKSQLTDDCYLAMAGSVKSGIVDNLRRELKIRFPVSDMEVPDAEDDTALYAYAYLEKTLPFRAAFDRLEEPLRFSWESNVATVAAFGIKKFTMTCQRDKFLQDQVTVLAYAQRRRFCAASQY